MRRAAALVSLSHDHHVVLESALRLRRATPDDVDVAAARFAAVWYRTGEQHFEQEEAVLLPALPADDPECAEAISRTLAEHARIREAVESLGVGDVEAARTLGTLLHDHVRFEERILFRLVEERLSPATLAEIGETLRASH